MKNEFIFSITEIFTSVLADANLERYYIGPYQRGYKWASSNYYDQVPQLLIDIYEAMQHKIGEYYLQYITVFENVGEKAYEVIDGQQRAERSEKFTYMTRYCESNIMLLIVPAL